MKKIIWIIVILIVLAALFFALGGQDNVDTSEGIDENPVFSDGDGIVDDVLNEAFAGFGELDGELDGLDAEMDTVADDFVDDVEGIGDDVFSD